MSLAGIIKKIGGYSMLAVLTVTLFLLLYALKGGVPNPLSWDLFGSHIYLPMAFDQHQFVYTDLSWMDSMREQYDLSPTLYQVAQWENGHIATRNTCGWAIVMLPFYVLAEVWAALAGYPTDGFSWPYQCVISIGALFYMCCGFLLLRKVLLHFFSDVVSAAVVLLVVFGTNLFFIQFASVGSTHNIAFFLVSAVLYFTIKFHSRQTPFNTIGLIVVLALTGLVRPPDLVVAIIPLFWNSREYGGIGRKWSTLIRMHGKKLLLAVIITLFLFGLQFAYWKITTGKLLVNSYKNAGEGFDWLEPHTLQWLFSFRKGWLLYTPLMVVALVGMITWVRKSPVSGKAAMVFVALFIYVTSTWTNWWYAGSYSQRAALDAYPVLAVGIGFFLVALRSQIAKWTAGMFILACLLLNFFQTWQVMHGIINLSQMSRKYYWSTFGQTTPPTAQQLQLLLPEENIHKKWTEKEEGEYVKYFNRTKTFQQPVMIGEGVEFGPVMDLSANELSLSEYTWLKVTWHYTGKSEGINGKIFTWNAMHKNASYAWRGNGLNDSLLVVDTVNRTVSSAYFITQLRSSKDDVSTSIWNQQGTGEPLRITAVTVEAFRLKDRSKYK